MHPYTVYICTFYLYLLISTLMFLFPQQRRKHFALRLVFSAAVGMICVVLFNSLFYGYLRNACSFLTALFSMVLMARFCFNITWSEAVFCAIGGYSVQFIQSTVAEMIERSIPGAYIYLEYFKLGSACIVLPLCYLLFCRHLKRGRNVDLNRLPLLLLLIGAVLIEIILCYNLRQEWKCTQDVVFLVSDCMLIIVCSFCLLTIQFYLLTKQNLEDQVDVLLQMLRKEQNQYQISKETIDSINRKCHDMRHQIHSIGENAKINPKALEEMEDAIRIYDALHKTGSPALDIILAEKALLCQNSGIDIQCMADGKKLAFMSDTDIYSLFGNLLENAIHAVQELSPDHRTISLTVRSHGSLLSINSHNRYAGQVLMENGMPVTASTDTMNRGFGVKSIAMIVEKYGGTASFQAEDGLFNLNILFYLDTAV